MIAAVSLIGRNRQGKGATVALLFQDDSVFMSGAKKSEGWYARGFQEPYANAEESYGLNLSTEAKVIHRVKFNFYLNFNFGRKRSREII